MVHAQLEAKGGCIYVWHRVVMAAVPQFIGSDVVVPDKRNGRLSVKWLLLSYFQGRVTRPGFVSIRIVRIEGCLRVPEPQATVRQARTHSIDAVQNPNSYRADFASSVPMRNPARIFFTSLVLCCE